MLNQNNRYVTIGVKESVDIRLQSVMWSLIDELKSKGDIKVNCLQIFRIVKDGGIIRIIHIQELPKYKNITEITVEDLSMVNDIDVFVIDSNGYSTMLLPKEY